MGGMKLYPLFWRKWVIYRVTLEIILIIIYLAFSDRNKNFILIRWPLLELLGLWLLACIETCSLKMWNAFFLIIGG